MIPGLIFLILVFSFVLIKSADLVVIALRRIARRTKTGVFTLSAIILALGTSFPELFVGITSALEGSQNLTLGVVLGSNIANISLVAGFTALIAGGVRLRGEYVKHDVWVALVAGGLPIFLVMDGVLSRVDGLILLAMYLAYATGFFRKRYIEIGKEQEEEESFFYRFVRRVNHVGKKQAKEYGRLFVGVALLLFSADAIVRFSSILAVQAKIPIFLVGLLVISIGTSLPELVFSLKSVEDNEPSMFFGNLLGSIIANSTLVIGTAVVIRPITVVAFNDYIVSVIAFLFIFVSFWFFIRSKHRLDRWEAALLVIFYLGFVGATFL